MITYQDYEKAADKEHFLLAAVSQHKVSPEVNLAAMADRYDKQQNDTINNYVQTLMTFAGDPIEDFTASNNKIASNFFQRLNTQRCMYSLGNGVTFAGGDTVKDKLGFEFDELIQDAGYDALIHGVSFVFWNVDRIHVFPLTEFVPIWDEETGELRAGIRYWRIAEDKPMTLVHYTEDGFITYITDASGDNLVTKQELTKYVLKTAYTPADDTTKVVGEENYNGKLPIVPLWGSRKKQSTLVGMREAIDSFDLIRSGFANDLTDCSQIYWIIENAGGMSQKDLARFRDQLKVTHIANADTEDGGAVRPYAQDIPYQARKQYLDDIRAGIYEDFGGLDVHTVAAGATNDHIDAAYQPMDENAQDFERQVTRCILSILKLAGIEDAPIYKRNRISNQKEQVEMVAMEAAWLDEETILSKLPNISADEIADILKRKDENELARVGFGETDDEDEEDEEGAEDE